jgi:cysteinyl-tRNA synthetase
MIEMISALLEKGHAYVSDGSVYFKVASFEDYGKLANLDPQGIIAGGSGRVDSDRYDRENVRDFALWKGWTEEDGDVYWDAPFGKGRPGWHIECSAMSMQYLGETFDFHTGAVDLIFPHHQNEIAQSESCTGKKFVNCWLHRSFVNFEGEKMAKSVGNVFTLEGLEKMPGGLKAYRYLIVTSHYRAPVVFSDESMHAAEQGLRRLEEFVDRLRAYSGDGTNDAAEPVEKARADFIEHMDDDLNAPRSIAAIHDLATAVNRLIDSAELSSAGADAVLKLMEETDSALGLFFETGERALTEEQEALIEARSQARTQKDWSEADRIRDLLLAQGIEVKDTPDGVRVTFVG